MVGEEDLRLCLGWSAASDASVSDSGEAQLAQESTGEDRGRQGSEEEGGGGGGVVGAPGAGRKKLRLSKEQASVLEDAFRQHHTLNPKQKLALAKELNLRPRQVEVWFQNRRARTKLKKTEVECELLKRCCENLAEENRRLQRELRELRALKRPAPAMQPAGDLAGRPPPITTTILAVCPSCERDATPRAAAAESKYHRRTTSLPLHLRQILLS